MAPRPSHRGGESWGTSAVAGWHSATPARKFQWTGRVLVLRRLAGGLYEATGGGADMSDPDIVHEAIERLEWDEAREERKYGASPQTKWHQVTRRTALTGGAAGLAALALEACGVSSSSSSTASAAGGGSGAAGIFGGGGGYKFTLVNHVTTNPFFTPTQNGAADACKLLGCSYQWTGSQNSNVGEMVNALQQRRQRRRGRHRGRPGRPQGVQPVRSPRRWRPRSRSSPTTPTPPATRAWPTSARTCTCPVRRWASTSPRSSRPATSPCSSPRPGR